MKKLVSIAIIFCLFIQAALAQSTDFRNQMNAIFGNVDLSQVPSGILFDYGLNLVDDSLYNGTLVADNILSSQVWKSLYADLWSSQVSTTGLISDIESINDAIDNYGTSEATLIPVLFYQYHRISPQAIDNNLMYISNDKLYDTPGRLQSPYIGQIAFAAAAMQSRFETTDGLVKFVFQQDCYFSNSGLTVSTIAVDANDGQGYRQVQWGSTLSCNYSTAGDKDIKVKFTFSDSRILYSHFTITVVTIPHLKSARYYNTETLTINPANVRAYNGQKATAEVTIIYNGSTSVLDKPLIVFEGYDTWRILTPDDVRTNYTWEDLLDEPYPQGYFILDFQSALASRGYDIVFVDYDNGTDYIQRNAYFAEAVINAVNQLKTGSEPNVVMGISMGGLVARYALSDMEARSEDHDARLFISMDSPHQGSNVPLGLQAMIRHLTDVKVEVGVPGLTVKVWDIGSTYPDYSALINLLQQPATRQMLIQQLSGFGEGIYIDNSVHTTFMQEYEQLGYPKQCRNIAVSNGSGSISTSWQYMPGSDIFSLSANCTSPWWTGFLNGFVVAASPYVKQLWEMPVVTLSSLLPGNYGVKAEFNIKSLPNIGTTKIYDGEIKILKKILWLIQVSSTLTSKEINYTGNNLPWTSAQGGFMSLDSYTGEIPSSLPSCVNMPPITGNFCFVPEVSSLDIQLSQNLLKGYTAANDLMYSMFDNIYTEPLNNKVHTNFNSNNTNWIVLELDKDPTLLQQSLIYKGCSISGYYLICPSGTALTVNNAPPGSTISWSTSSNITRESAQGDNPCTFTPSGSGEGWIKATISTIACGDIVLPTKYVTAGQFNFELQVSPLRTNDYGEPKACPYTDYVFTLDENGAPCFGYDLSWTVPSTWTINYTDRSTISINTNDDPANFIYVDFKNCCWEDDYASLYFVDGWPCGDQMLVISPNPTNGEATVTIESSSGAKSFDENAEWDIEVYGASQNLQEKKPKLKGSTAKLQTAGWKEGVYLVRAVFKDEILTGKLVVKK